jgi:hypothetical protein
VTIVVKGAIFLVAIMSILAVGAIQHLIQFVLSFFCERGSGCSMKPDAA